MYSSKIHKRLISSQCRVSAKGRSSEPSRAQILQQDKKTKTKISWYLIILKVFRFFSLNV